jgi:hypothetical protein
MRLLALMFQSGAFRTCHDFQLESASGAKRTLAKLAE